MSRTNPAFLYPPDPEKSLRHRKANQIFKGLTPSDTETCECCNRRLASGQPPSSCCLDPDQLSFLGPGVPLFFLYLRMTILLLLTMSVLFASFALYSNLTTNDCSSLQLCSGNIMNLMSLINKRSSQLYFTIQGYIQLGFILVAVVFFQGVRLYGRKLEKECDEVIDSPSDYAVILRRLPTGTTEKDVMEMVEQRRRGLTEEQVKTTENLKVVKVILSYSLREYLSVGEQNTQSFKTAIKTGEHSTFTPLPQPHPTTPSSIAIVIFQHQSSKDLLIHRPSLFQRVLQALCTPCIPISDLTVRGVPIGVERAPEPDDICWQNSGITMGGGILRKILYGSIAFLVLLLGGGAQYGLELLYNSTSDSTLQTILTVSNSLVILLFNSIIMLTLITTTHKERNETLTEYQSVLMTKQTIFQFFNAGLFVIGSEVAAKSDRFSLNDGVCMQISAIMMANCFVPSLTLFLLTYTEVVNKIQATLGEGGCLQMTQQELNELYLGPAVDLPSKYAYILKIVWLTGLYAPLVPIVTVVAVLGLGMNYLVEKLLFAKSYSLPNTVSSQTYENAVELLQYFIITFAMGQLVVYFYFYSYRIEQIPLLTLITIFLSLGIGAANLILPMRAINEAIFPLPESAKSQVRYSAIQEKFQVTYEMNNPAYKTDRERRNVKDVLGLRAEGKEKDTGMAVALEMTSLFAGSLGESRQPLLKEGMGGGQDGQGRPIKHEQNQDSIFTAILKNDSNNITQSGTGSGGNQQVFNSAIENFNNGKKQETTPSPIGKESGDSGMTPSDGNLKDPRQELRSIKKQLTPSNTLQNQPYNPNAPIPNPNANQSTTPSFPIPASNKSSLPSGSTANDSFFKRTITPSQPMPSNNRHNLTEPNFQALQGGDGEKINISVLEPNETRPLERKGPIRPLDIDSRNEGETVPINTNNTNSSTKYKKPPEGFSKPKETPQIQEESQEQQPHPHHSKKDPNAGLLFQLLEEQPEEERRKTAFAKQQEEEQARQQQALAKQQAAKITPPPPQRNSYDDAPIGINRPMVPQQTSPESSSKKHGIYTPLIPCEEFKFQDPKKDMESRYEPRLIDNKDTPQKVEQRSHLNGQGIMKALGRPFTSFTSRMSVEGMTERSGKNLPKEKPIPH